MKMIKTLGAALLCAASSVYAAALIEPSSSVVVVPLRYTYQVVQDFQYDYARVDSSLKGYAHESSSASYKESYRDGRYSSGAQASASQRSDGNYNLKAHQEAEAYSYNDRTVIEKSLSSHKFTGIIESALSEAGVRVARTDMTFDPKHPEASTKKAIERRIGDYVLSGEIISMRMGGIRKVPDGTNRRYSVESTVKLSLIIMRARDGVSTFSRTFTGKGTKTFDAVDYIPAEETMDIAMDSIAQQITAAVLGQRIMGPSETDSEYQDSPGKRLRD